MKGLKELLESNTKNILSQTKQMNEKWATMASPPKTEDSPTKTTSIVNLGEALVKSGGTRLNWNPYLILDEITVIFDVVLL